MNMSRIGTRACVTAVTRSAALALLALLAGCGSERADTRVDAASPGHDADPVAARTPEMPAQPPVPAKSPIPAQSPVTVQPTLDDHGLPVGLHNYHKWSGKIGGGAQPEGEEAFRNLSALGYRVVLSVDGARPDLENAEKYGLRYVHVPIGYDGVPQQERLEIAKAVQTAEGPVYIHCHHGKHRSAAAIAVAGISTEGMSHQLARKVLETCGTDPKYKGLYAAADTCPVPSADELAKIPAILPNYRKPGDLAETMVDVDLRWDHLVACKAASWGVPSQYPDVDPPHEAMMLWEHYRELARTTDAKGRGADFLKLLADAETSAKDLEVALRANDAKAADAAHDKVKKSCTACHAKYRDN